VTRLISVKNEYPMMEVSRSGGMVGKLAVSQILSAEHVVIAEISAML